MKPYENRLKYFAILHIVTILLTGIFSTAKIYDDYNLVKNKSQITKWSKCQNQPAWRYYMRYTGTETGFGFFAPSVKSNGYIIPKYNGTKFAITLNTNEGNSRFSSLISNITDDVLTEAVTNRKQKNDVIAKYNDLMLKNIIAKFKSGIVFSDSKDLEVTYFLYEYHTLKEIDKGKLIKPYLTQVKTWNYEAK